MMVSDLPISANFSFGKKEKYHRVPDMGSREGAEQ
jgi:hypothetical protein